MTKNKTKVTEQPISTEQPQFTDEQLAAAREMMRKNMRESFDKWVTVYDEDADDEYISQCKKEFDDEVQQNVNKKFVLTTTDAKQWVKLILEWNRNYNHWEKGGWRGLITLDRVMREFNERLNEDETLPFEVDYATLLYLHQTMFNPAGTGLDSAYAMAELENVDTTTYEPIDNDAVSYSEMLTVIDRIIKELTAIDKKLKLMRERINIGMAGIKFDWKISEVEEFVEFHNAWVGQAVSEQDVREAQNQAAY